MKDLSCLINSFDDEEADLIVKHYLIKSNSSSKRLKLFNLIRLEGISDNQIAAKKLYNKAPNAAFSQLKKRLKEDILNLMLVFQTNQEHVDGFAEVEMQASKQILQGKMLIKRGLTAPGVSLIQKAFKLAGDHEAFEVQMLAYETLKTYSDSCNCTYKINELESQFSKNVNILYDLINLRIDNKEDIIKKETIQSSYTISVDEGLVNQATEPCEIASSFRLMFQQTMNLLETFIKQEKYRRAMKIADGMIPILENDHQILTRAQKGVFYLQVSKAVLCLKLYEKAQILGSKAIEKLESFDHKRMEAFEILFRSYFCANDYKNAERILEEWSQCVNIPDNYLIEIEIFKANLHFVKGNYKPSVKILYNCVKNRNLSAELTMNGKLLELLNLLEMKDFEWFDYKLENLRKFLKYIPVNEKLNRFMIIFKLLCSIKKNRYNKHNLHLEGNCVWYTMLLEENQPHSWNPLTMELIPLNQWVVG